MKKVIVTGALGFIGFHLCNELLQKGIEVYGIDCMLDDERRKIQEEKLHLFGRNSLFHYIDKPIEDINFETMLEGVDVLFHLAAATKKDSKWQNLRETIHHNVKGTRQIIQACTEKTRIVYASTLQVYGERYGVVTEATPTNPITPYGLTKLVGESILFQERKKNNVPVVILRLPTVYGPWQRPDMTYAQLLENIYSKRNKKVDTDRLIDDIIYVQDVVEAFLLAAETAQVNEVFNISSGSRDEWYRGKEYITGEKESPERNERLRVTISTEKANSVLGFSKRISIEEGIEKQREHFKKIQQRLD